MSTCITKKARSRILDLVKAARGLAEIKILFKDEIEIIRDEAQSDTYGLGDGASWTFFSNKDELLFSPHGMPDHFICADTYFPFDAVKTSLIRGDKDNLSRSRCANLVRTHAIGMWDEMIRAAKHNPWSFDDRQLTPVKIRSVVPLPQKRSINRLIHKGGAGRAHMPAVLTASGDTCDKYIQDVLFQGMNTNADYRPLLAVSFPNSSKFDLYRIISEDFMVYWSSHLVAPGDFKTIDLFSF